MSGRTTNLVAAMAVVGLVACLGLVAGCSDDSKEPKPESTKTGDEKSMSQKAGEKVGELTRKAKDTAGSAVETVKEKSVEAFEASKESATDFGKGVKEGYTAKDKKLPVEVPSLPTTPDRKPDGEAKPE